MAFLAGIVSPFDPLPTADFAVLQTMAVEIPTGFPSDLVVSYDVQAMSEAPPVENCLAGYRLQVSTGVPGEVLDSGPFALQAIPAGFVDRLSSIGVTRVFNGLLPGVHVVTLSGLTNCATPVTPQAATLSAMVLRH